MKIYIKERQLLERLAMADKVITKGEKLLKRLASRFHILEEEYSEILQNILHILHHNNYNERIEHLYNLGEMIYADGEVSGDETKVLRSIYVGLGLPIGNVEKVADETIHLILNNTDLENFTKAIKYVK
jgi:uncharacterized tellurite resistance protein B-like protein